MFQTLQHMLTYLDSIEDILILFCHFFYSVGENKFVYCNKFLAFNIRSINPIQKYLHIIESNACIL